MAADSRPTLTLGHSPDADDAFMWWPIAPAGGQQPLIRTERFAYRPVPLDIEALNRRAIASGDLDITALSVHAYPFVADRYALTASGGSFGDGYGPKVVARAERSVDWLVSQGVVIASPGEKTTAHLALRLLLGRPFDFRVMPFDRVIDAVASGEADAGLVIHEGQLTYADAGLACVADLGAWWKERTDLPLPLGVNVIRRDLDERYGAGAQTAVAADLERSLEAALADRARGLEAALAFAGDLSRDRLERFVGLYVNDLTRDMGARGVQAIRALLSHATAAGLTPEAGDIAVVKSGAVW